MTRALIWFISGWIVAMAMTSAALWWTAARYGPEIYHSWTVFPYVPVCREFEGPFQKDVFDQFRPVSGEPTKEFWEELIKAHKRYRDFQTPSWTNIAVVNGKLQVSASLFWTRYNPFSDLEEWDDPEERVAWPNMLAAYSIYEDRLATGKIHDENLTPFHVMQVKRRFTRPPKPDECGFMEELILKG